MNNPLGNINNDKVEEAYKPVEPENDIKEPIEPAEPDDIDKEPAEDQPEPIYEPNILDIDFVQLIASETDDDIRTCISTFRGPAHKQK